MERCLAILGGCGGIGRQLVREAVASGFRPIVFDLPRSIEAHPIDGIQTHAVDASDPDNVMRAADQLSGTVHGFVNLCGFMTGQEPLVSRPTSEWDEVISGNLNAAFFASRAFAPRVAKGGAIVHVGSGLGHLARPGYGPYAVAKAGIAAMTRQMAIEMAPNVRVNCVAPSAVDTSFLRGGTGRSNEDEAVGLDIDAYSSAIPLKRIALPQDVSGPILFLLSDAAGYITGQVLHVNGGAHMP